jgi:hypothetical protein
MPTKNPTGRPCKFKTPEQIQPIIDKYFYDCDLNKTPYTITGLAIALDTTRELLAEYERKDGFSATIKKAKHRCENYAEEHGYSAKNPAFAIFCLKNYGWRDRQDVEVSADAGIMAAVAAMMTKQGDKSDK